MNNAEVSEMTLKCVWTVTALIMACLWSSVSSAHHSFATFDMAKTLSVTGTVKEWVWANPHSWIYLMVPKADGTQEEWAFECSSPNMMSRWGWKYSDIKVGDKLIIDTHPARDGKFHGSVYAVFLPSGKTLVEPMGELVTGDQLAEGPPTTPTKPTGIPYR
jgi:Family of unknown function (DUF6152)